MDKPIDILGVPVDRVTYDDVLQFIDETLVLGSQNQVVTVNPEMVVLAQRNPDFMSLLKSSSLRTPDGAGILWAARRLGFLPLPMRVTGTDLMARIIDQSQVKPWTLFLLGAEEGIAEKAIQNLKNQYPRAQFVGSYAGLSTHEGDDEAIRRINLAGPNILFVAYGNPAQEFWIQRNLSKLPSIRIAIGVGGAFDFYAGKRRRAPAWIRNSGLEWSYRLFQEPKRIGRIWNAVVQFSLLILKSRKSR